MVTVVNPRPANLLQIAVVNPEEAKRIVLQYAERNKVNASWLAREIGEHRQTVWYWLNGEREPADPTVWAKLATALGVASRANSELIDDARELALEVLLYTDNEDLKNRAANLIREISKKSLSDR
ncbi:MAG: XRE family transcriptional regulator [Desulfurellales bacterium]|nr:MAG: XRE family transcriptional regulator [Desulfurellales bacterium]